MLRLSQVLLVWEPAGVGQIANRQSLVSSGKWSALAGHSAIPRGTSVARMNANRAI